VARLTGLLQGVATTGLALARTEHLRRRIRDTARRTLRTAALMLGGAALLALGLAFLLAATYLQLSDWIGPKGAAAVLAVTMIAAGAGCWAVATASSAKPPPEQPRSGETGALSNHLGDLGQTVTALRHDVVRIVADKPELVVLGAFLVGLISGRRKRGRD